MDRDNFDIPGDDSLDRFDNFEVLGDALDRCDECDEFPNSDSDS
jgi:hypothetical protein